MNAAQVDLQQLRIKHILYKSKVRSALYGGSYDESFFSDQGPVNTWFEAIGLPKYQREPEIQELTRLQQDLNRTVTYLTNLYRSGKIEEAYEGLNTIELKSEKFLSLVTKLESRLANLN